MSGMCGKHRETVEGCVQCSYTLEDIFPDAGETTLAAKEAGEFFCVFCGFVFYLAFCNAGYCCPTLCPKCGTYYGAIAV